MPTINEVCQNIVEEVDDSLAAAVVDLDTGLLLGYYHTLPGFTDSYLDMVAAAAADMFRGKNVRQIEKQLSVLHDEEILNTIQEAQLTTSHTYHFMAIIPGKPNALAILITSKGANMGLGWAGLRSAITCLAPICP
jgi:hypothetical protein